MTTKNASYDPNALMFDICQQRKRRQLNNIPPVRFELTTSPYNQYSQKQLDMRRKIEILKYIPILQSNQTNSQTKKEKTTAILKGTYKQLYNKLASQQCPNDEKIPTLTSSCDVPGPVILLTYDPSVPLYNYISDLQTRSYSSLPQDITIPWSISFTNNVDFFVSYDSNYTDYVVFSSIFFRYILNQPQIYFNLTLPVQLSINATGNRFISGSPILSSLYNITINIIQIKLAIYYNQIETNNITVLNNPHLSSTIIISDISGGSDFYLNQLNIGYIQVPQIAFQSQTGFIYDLKMSWNVNMSVNNKNNANDTNDLITLFQTFQVKITANTYPFIATTQHPSQITYNCSPTPSPIIPPFSLVSNEYYVGNPPTILFDS